MKKHLSCLFVITSSLVAVSACSSSGDGNEKPTDLVISTWGFAEDFFKEEVYKPFEEEYNVNIVVDIGNNAERLNKIRQGTANVDVVYLSDYYAQQGIEEGLFAEIDRSNIENIDNLYDIAKAPLGEEYGPAYTIGQFGIAYNPEQTKGPIESWSDLWDDSLAGNLTIPSITSTTGPMFLDAASIVAGQEEFNADAAFAAIADLKGNIVKEYDKSSDFVNMFTQGEIAAGPFMEMYFHDLQAAVPEAEFVTPTEGGYAVMNTVNVVKDSDNKELAEAFINWHLSKEVQEASAKAKVDSPVNIDVELSEQEAEGVTYGEETIEALNLLDMEYVNSESAEWIDRWNKEIAN
ncbi:ABC transporter substrate-binding protein [Shouchella clausii]|uniref:ABC transporter substrate-binding protein n=1 Tax=Shouchella clausii TaxID=79880 RepID=UPI000B977A91|nr:ABC transporter substrate-binding protein [Shouchella clausii]AST96593.1 spermidine/putrescine ABC transporter substrate-binding protein [Shouchella clausii]MCR1288313.1 ABC transporter substrate-binding protein [Shouchella clausii]MEB5471194.1 ABC transporter substrate-binding protein [Shouchella clausii]QNM42949.1 ABC transporter substrate-binding protein [Shouchella clausii]WMM30793.1 ABC transporter substrate-binding protein [Shouchella clausii]